MALNINTAFSQRMTSSGINEKINDLVGQNVKLYGFDASKVEENRIQLSPGKVLIKGASIEVLDESTLLEIQPEFLIGNKQLYAVIRYNHLKREVVFLISDDLSKAENEYVVVATINIINSKIEEIINSKPIPNMMSNSAMIAESTASLVRNTIPSGFTRFPVLRYMVGKAEEDSVNALTTSNEAIAYIDGYEVRIPMNTVIDIGEPPEKDFREDLVFLEAWKAKDFNLTGELSWRIRHAKGAPFDIVQLSDGLGYKDGNFPTEYYSRAIMPQGGLIEPLKPTSDNSYYMNMFRMATIKTYNWQSSVAKNDTTLLVAGTSFYGNDYFNTLDGMVYAIPIFRISRRPGQGVMKGDYSRVSSLVDPVKLNRILREEKISGINAGDVKLSLKGKTLRNLFDFAKFREDAAYGSDKIYDYSWATITNNRGIDDREWDQVKPCATLEPNTEYTLILVSDQSQIRTVSAQFSLNKRDIININIDPRVEKRVSYRFNSGNSTDFLFKMFDTERDITARPNMGVVLLKGNHNENEIASPFRGIQSAGENEVAFDRFVKFGGKISKSISVGDVYTFPYKPKGNYLAVTPVKANGEELLDANIAFRLLDKNGRELAWLPCAGLKLYIADTMMDSIKSIRIFHNSSLTKDIDLAGFNVYNGSLIRVRANDKTENKESVREIILKEPLRKLSDQVFDVYSKGYVKRTTGCIIARGFENWQINGNTPNQVNTLSFFLRTKNMANHPRVEIICDKFKTVTVGYFDSHDEECVTRDRDEAILIRIRKDRLKTPDIAGFKSYLVNNPITFIYDTKLPTIELLSLPGGVSDLDDEQGTITRLVKQITYNGTENWKKNQTDSGEAYSRYFIALTDSYIGGEYTSNNFEKAPIDNLGAGEGIIISQGRNLHVKILKSKLETPDVDGFKKWLAANNTTVTYQLDNIINESYAVERELETRGDLYFNDENYKINIDTQVTPYVSVSHEADLNIKVPEGESKITTFGKGLKPKITIGDKSGEEISLSLDKEEVLPIDKVEGQTIQNVLPPLSKLYLYRAALKGNRLVLRPVRTEFCNVWDENNAAYKPNTEYTVVINVLSNNLVLTEGREDSWIYVGSNSSNQSVFTENFRVDLSNGKTGKYSAVLTTINDVDSLELNKGARLFLTNSYNGGSVEIEYMVIEGRVDVRNLDYFEGMLSVGGEKDILNIKSQAGDNLFNALDYGVDNGVLPTILNSNEIIMETVGDWKTLTYDYILKPNTKYSISFNREYLSGDKTTCLFVFTEGNKVLDVFNNGQGDFGHFSYSFTTGDTGVTNIVLFGSALQKSKQKYSEIMFCEGEPKPFVPYVGSVKGLSLGVEGLKAINNEIRDTIERREDGYYLVRRVGKAVLDHNRYWTVDEVKERCIGFKTDIVGESQAIICDTFKVQRPWQEDRECIYNYGNSLSALKLSILKSKLPTQDEEGLKAWLKQNPITIYYELDTPLEIRLQSNLRTDKVDGVLGLSGQVRYKKNPMSALNMINILLEQSINPNWWKVGEIRKFKYTLRGGNIYDTLDVPLIPASQVGTSTTGLDCPYKIKIIKALPNNECIARNIGKNDLGGQAEFFYAPEFLGVKVGREDIREIYPKVSLTGWDYTQLLEEALLNILK